MKKIAIMTVTGDNNYGNKLQNYALQYTLNKIGGETETVRIEKTSYRRVFCLTYIQKMLICLLPTKKKNIIKRRLCFFLFNKNINQHHVVIKKSDSAKKKKQKLAKFDYLLYGSDQIWNPDLPQYSDVFWGKYAAKERNIAVSASIGRSTVPKEYIDEFTEGIKNFKAISVREKAARECLLCLSNELDPIVLVDPSFMVGTKQWISLEKKVNTPDKYCLTYYLGKESNDIVNTIGHDKGYEIVDAGPSEPYGPGEFIYLIRHAEKVITDSFHAAVFSIMFGRDLYIIQRQDKYASMNSRIDTLLDKTGIVPENIDGMLHIMEGSINNGDVLINIENERSKFINFLKDNLEMR